MTSSVSSKSPPDDLEKATQPEDAQEPEIDSEARAATEEPAIDPNIVTWSSPSDPENPQNWSIARKFFLTTILALSTLIVALASSIFSSTEVALVKEFGVDKEVTILGTSLFVLGYCFGPIFFGPLSEKFGRRIPLLIGVFGFAIFCIPVAVGQNIETVLVCRFLSGAFGAAPQSIVGGAMTDMWNAIHRGVAVIGFIAAVQCGPLFGPIIGGFITESHLGWRWTMWLVVILGLSIFFVLLVLLPETYGPVLLSQQAKKMRFSTKNWALRSKFDEEETDLREVIRVYLFRPYILLATEPILMLVTLYQSLIYGIVYLLFQAYPISFIEHRHWKPAIASLPFIGLVIGMLIGLAIALINTLTVFARQTRENDGKVVPETRLPIMMVGAICMPVGIFWFAWTSNPSIPWAAQVVAGVPIGTALFLVFIQGFNYMIDVYLFIANSAISANTVVRSIFAFGFPLFAPAMYDKLGVSWATSLLGFIMLAMVPIPFVFYRYGSRIRQMSKYSPNKI